MRRSCSTVRPVRSWAKNPDLRWAPASTTKIMTGLLAAEAIDSGAVSLDDTVTIDSDVNIEGGGSAGLAAGDTISLRDLLHMTLIPSKNDAASAVGTYIANRIYACRFLPPNQLRFAAATINGRALFVAEMNARAADLGLDDTSYVDISARGPEDLNDDGAFPAPAGCEGNDSTSPPCAHYTTARDLAALASVALDNSLFAQIVNTPDWRTTTWTHATDPERDTTYTTSNQLPPGQPYLERRRTRLTPHRARLRPAPSRRARHRAARASAAPTLGCRRRVALGDRSGCWHMCRPGQGLSHPW
jgi:D-alanyl-D-alanine carboxypeptidase